jgi:serine phosphatase RsbU (regulator of sigma subunit)/catechol 2,3-dioxygenase-like lactoylglutathione lyase family enzyme
MFELFFGQFQKIRGWSKPEQFLLVPKCPFIAPRRIISPVSAHPSPNPSPHLRIHSINIYVRDQDRSLRFYLDQLGFHLAYDAKLQSGERLVAVAPPDGQAVLTLIAPKPDSLDFKLIGRSTRLTLITEDVLAKYQEWSRRGVRFQHTPRLRRIKFDPETRQVRQAIESPLLGEESPIWGGVSTRFRDPDGNTYSLVSFDEITHALEAQRRAAAAKLEAERRVAQELEIAAEVQCRLFPQLRPPIQALDYAGHCHSARAVGGDYYDFLDLGPGRFGLVVADVSGKGIAAALLMANLQANLRSQCAVCLDQPQRLLQAVNQLFCQNTPDGAFATLFLADYHVPTGRLRYINCGHPPALVLRRDDSIDRLHATATVLGIFKKWDCELREQTIHPGDTLVLYTDGITESFNESRDEFGEARLIQSLLRHRSHPSQSLLDNIVADVRQFSPHEQHDDITLIVAKASLAPPS